MPLKPVRAWLTPTYPTCSADPVLGASSSELETGLPLLLAGKSCFNTQHCWSISTAIGKGLGEIVCSNMVSLPPPEPLVTWCLQKSCSLGQHNQNIKEQSLAHAWPLQPISSSVLLRISLHSPPTGTEGFTAHSRPGV